MPCHSARARKLFKTRRVAHPLTTILLEREEGEIQRMQLKFDPSSKVTYGERVIALPFPTKARGITIKILLFFLFSTPFLSASLIDEAVDDFVSGIQSEIKLISNHTNPDAFYRQLTWIFR